MGALTVSVPTPRFQIGQKYRIKRKRTTIEYEVVDILITFNAAGEYQAMRYVCARQLMGQTVLDRSVVETTIAIALDKEAAG